MYRSITVITREVIEGLGMSAHGLFFETIHELAAHGLTPVSISGVSMFDFHVRRGSEEVPWPIVRYVARLPYGLRARARFAPQQDGQQLVLSGEFGTCCVGEEYALLDIRRLPVGASLIQFRIDDTVTIYTKLTRERWRYTHQSV